MKIRIVLPASHHLAIDPRCLNSVKMLLTSGIAEFEFIPSYSSEIGYGRSAGVRAIKKSDGSFISDIDDSTSKALPDFDFVLSLDSDIEFTIENVEQLLAAHEQFHTVVCGCFKARYNDNVINAGYFREHNAPLVDHDRSIFISELSDCKHKALVVEWSSFGFSLIPRDVFYRVRAPWFVNYVTYFTRMSGTQAYRYIHEDVGFSELLYREKIPLIVDPSCFVNHLI